MIRALVIRLLFLASCVLAVPRAHADPPALPPPAEKSPPAKTPPDESVLDVPSSPGPRADPPAGETPPPSTEADRLEADRLEAELERALGADTSSEASAAVPSTSGGGLLTKILPDIALILDVAGAYFSQDPLQLGGHDPSGNGFTFRQLEMSLRSNVDPYFRFDANLVFTLEGVEVEEAYGTTVGLPGGLQVRAGQMLTRFGRLNGTHPHAWSFVDQPLVNGHFLGGDGSRGLGVELSWLAPLPWYVELAGMTHMPAGECCSRGYSEGAIESAKDLLYTATLKQFFPLDDSWSLSWGLSGQLGPNNAPGDNHRTALYGTDLYLRFRPVSSVRRTALSLTVEAMYRRRETDNQTLEDFGGYTQLVWNIDPAWEIGARYGYLQGQANDWLDPEQTEDRHRVTLELGYYPSHFSLIRLQGSWDRPKYRSEAIYALMLNLELIAGTHGAHTF